MSNKRKRAVDLDRLLKTAVADHQSGALQRAEAGYRKILRFEPNSPDALNLLGVLMHQRGQDEIAASLIETAIKLNSQDDSYHYNLGEVQRAAGDYSAAVASYRKAIELAPTEADYYFGLGIALCDSGRPEDGVSSYRKAVRLNPKDAEIHNNLGNVLAELGDFETAVIHFREALRLRPDYAEGHANLGNVLKELAETEQAIASYQKALALQPELAGLHYNLGVALDEQGQVEQAMECYRKAVSLDPALAQAYMNLGRLLKDRGELQQSLQSYRRAVDAQPDSVKAVLGMGSVLQDLDEFAEAAEWFQKAIELAPEDAGAFISLGVCLGQLDRQREAVEYFQKALEIDPHRAEAHFNLGTTLQAQGRFDEAIACHRKALELNPELAEAAYQLSSIQSFKAGNEEIDRLLTQLQAPSLQADTRINLHFALAKMYEDRGDYDDAFSQYRLGNELKAGLRPFDQAASTDTIDRTIATFTDAFHRARKDFGLSSELPVFIVGMPRSGSTLVEQIISSHPRAHGAGELNDLRALVRGLPKILKTSTPVPECLALLDRDTTHQLAESYLTSLSSHALEASRICDKSLGNFLRLGLIQLMFPRARVIHCKRHPLDTCTSCYAQNFAHGLRFTYDLEHVAVVYRDYHRLMEHWREVLSLRMLDVQYEELVADQEAISRRLIEFCGLQWDDRCLQFYQHERDVSTASFWQVRQPMYSSSVGRWRAYQQHLGPLIEALGELAHD